MTVDIHDYPQKYDQAVRAVERSTISEHNKQLILSYRDACLLHQTCGRVRLLRVLGVLTLYATILEKDFELADRADINRLVTSLQHRTPAYSAETIGTYKAILKRFYTWLPCPDEFNGRTSAPPLVSWITTHVRSRDKHHLQRHDLLLPTEVERAINATNGSRDAALVAVLWETGCRISEIGNLQLKHVTRTREGITLDVTGKTGQRSPMIVESASRLQEWIREHPRSQDPDAPLWVSTQGANRALTYGALRKIIRLCVNGARIDKRVYPHLFRHSRATYVLAKDILNEAQAKAYFGWSPSSDMLARYAHLLASDANEALLRSHQARSIARAETRDDRDALIAYLVNRLKGQVGIVEAITAREDERADCHYITRGDHLRAHDLSGERIDEIADPRTSRVLIPERPLRTGVVGGLISSLEPLPNRKLPLPDPVPPSLFAVLHERP